MTPRTAAHQAVSPKKNKTFFKQSQNTSLPNKFSINLVILYLIQSIFRYNSPQIVRYLEKFIHEEFNQGLCIAFTYHVCFSSVQSLSRVQLFATQWKAAHQASLSITNSWTLSKLMSIELVMPSNHLILCRPLLLLPPIPPSIRVFSNESALHIRWSKYWSFSFSISPSNEHTGLISFRMDCLDLLAVQGTLKSLLQHHSSKASILQHLGFFMVQFSHPGMTTG